jgi:hypothetical protein
MSEKPKLSSRPPVRSIEDFISEAERRPEQKIAPEQPAANNPSPKPATPEPKPARKPGRRMLPWERPSIREDVKKPFNLRLPEEYLLKLKHISENTPDSMQKFCLRVLMPAIDKKIGELTARDDMI